MNTAGGDTLNIRSGTYADQNIFFTGIIGSAGSPSVVQNYQSETAVITCNSQNTARVSINGGTAYMTIQGTSASLLELHDCNQGWIMRAATDHITIQNTYVHDIGQECVHPLENSTFTVIQNNIITRCNQDLSHSNGEGVYIGNGNDATDHTNNCSVLNNSITFTSDEGTELKSGTHDCIVRGNTYSDNLRKTDFNTDPTTGVIEVDEGTATSGTPNHLIVGNTINTTRTGIQLATASKAYNNVIYGIDSASGFWCLYARNGAADAFTRVWYENTCQVTTAQAIGSSGSPTIDSKNNIGPTAANGNLPYSAAYFVNAASGDFHLVAASAPIGAGVNTLATVPLDKAGVARSNPPDIGAFQFSGPASSLSGTAKLGGNGASIH